MAGGIDFLFDFSLVLEGNLRNGEGITTHVMNQGLRRAERAAMTLASRQAAGEIGFPGLPFLEKEARALSRYAAGMRKRFTHLLVLGIGGSALGPQLVADALAGERDRLRPWFLDNTDPDGIDRTLREIGDELRRTLSVVISK